MPEVHPYVRLCPRMHVAGGSRFYRFVKISFCISYIVTMVKYFLHLVDNVS